MTHMKPPLSRRAFGTSALGLGLALGLPSLRAEAMYEGGSILRSPEEAFDGLLDYDFEPHYLEIPYGRDQSLRMHYVDEGPRDAPVVLCLHGQGSWAYIYRHVIPKIVAAGLRAVAPDYIGFGRSDKLASEEDYTFKAHIEWIKYFVREMQFDDVTPIMFDWGGFFGLRVMAEEPDMFDRVVLSNTQLPILDEGESAWFKRFRAMVLRKDDFPMGSMVSGGVRRGKLAPEIIAAYDAPFPDQSYKAGPRAFPMIHPITEYDAPIAPNRAAWEALKRFDKPTLTVFADSTAATSMRPEKLHAQIPGCAGQSHVIIPNTGFYVVEDAPDELADAVITFVKGNT
jgi:haloalkane dehalogenase